MGEITYVDGYDSSVLNTFSNEEFSVDTEMYTTSQNMDATFKAERGTAHVHAPIAIADKAASCTEAGYTGRTYCEVCKSVVDWGTTIPATGHNYEIVGDKLVCECGKESTASGLQNIDGKNYYTVNGKLISEWQMVGDEWYYFDKTTFAGLNGEQYTEEGIKFTFDNGRVTNGVWVRNSNGLRYWYGPGYYKDSSRDINSAKPYEVDGKTYLFNRQGYMQTGIAYSFTPMEILYYDCGDDGVTELLTGSYGDSFYIDGVKVASYQLVQDKNGDFYFVNDGYKLAKNTRLYLNEQFVAGHFYPDGQPIQPGYYDFDADGKMIIRNGPVGDYFYVNGIRQDAYQLVEYEGNYYFINDSNKLAKNVTLYLSKTYVEGKTFADGSLISAGYYTFDANGKMVLN